MIAALLDHLWQSTLFCGVIWSITLALRANRASLRHGLWMAASIKFLVPFSALYTLGALAGLPAATGGQPIFLSSAAAVAAPVVSPTDFLRAAAPAGLAAGTLLSGAWLLGAAIVAIRWLIAWRAADAIVKTARPAPGEWSDTHVTDADIEPAVAGVFRPVLLLPSALLARLTSTQLVAVLAHEREHIRRRDNLTAHVHRIAEALFWFHPAVWWIGRQLVEERERACDEAVLDGGHAGADYAAGILNVCRHCNGRAPVALGATGGDLAQRVRRILYAVQPRETGFFKSMALLSGALITIVVPLLAGAADGSAQRLQRLDVNARTLGAARFSISVAAQPAGRPSLVADDNLVVIRDSSIRDLVAMAYDVERFQVEGSSDWLDGTRYDVHAIAPRPVNHPDDLDPAALRVLITRLLAARFNLEVHVNSVCQQPCGRLTEARAAL